jgi:predicted HAD superfamily phosphohydrolase YqeG|tara:strand:+ start:4740 stop:4991 length:252 start_codon:yes stop_codon:yes gene_type:complete
MPETYNDRAKRIAELHKLELLKNSIQLGLDIDTNLIEWVVPHAEQCTIQWLSGSNLIVQTWEAELRKQGIITVDDFYRREGLE